MDSYDIHPDTFRRWYKISQLIPSTSLKILDVGGHPNNEQMKLLIPNEIDVANPQYNNISGDNLPYEDNYYDITMTIDTLEHVPPVIREKFINELLRTCRQKAIIACPFDEPHVADFEKTIYSITRHPLLKEHIEFGLPKLQDTIRIIEKMGYSYRIYNNDSLISWASWLLLHQTLSGRVNLRPFNRLLNQIYEPDADLDMSYRKIIEIFKNSPRAFKKKGKRHKHQSPHAIQGTRDLISIVIPTTTLQYLDECLNSIEKNSQNMNYEIIIINDGSNDPQLLAYLNECSHTVVNLGKNIGFGAANNVGFKIARGEYIMTINADTLVWPNWLEQMLNTIKRHHNCAAVGPTSLLMGTDIIHTAGCDFDPSDFRFFKSKFDQTKLNDCPDAKMEYQVDALGGVCILFKRQALYEVAFFDEDFINGWEDMDISMSFRKKGYVLYHAPATIEHKGSFVRDKLDNYNELVTKNRETFINKWEHFISKSREELEEEWNTHPFKKESKEPLQILYANVIELNKNWGAEWFVKRGFEDLGHKTDCIDYRKNRQLLGEIFSNLPKHDVFFLQRGDTFPLEAVKKTSKPRLFWASELLSRCHDHDHLLQSGLFDHIFFHSRQCVETAVSKGWIERIKCSVLLNGFDPAVHKNLSVIKKDIDVLFIGNITPRRKHILSELQRKVKINISTAYGDEFVNLINRSKIILNIHAEEFPDTETRIFEALGCGGFVISETLSEDNPFSDNHLIECSGVDALSDKILYYLNNSKERESIARAGYEEAIRKHTYKHRAMEIVDKMKLAIHSIAVDSTNENAVLSKYNIWPNETLGLLFDKNGKQTNQINIYYEAVISQIKNQSQEITTPQAMQKKSSDATIKAFEFADSCFEHSAWAISKDAFEFITHKFGDKINGILEFGGGYSTLFWAKWFELTGKSGTILTFEHDQSFWNELTLYTQPFNFINVQKAELKQLSDQEYESIFNSLHPEQLYPDLGKPVPIQQYSNTRIKNSFYQIEPDIIANKNINLIVLDGPHGNGRAIAFPLIKNIVTPPFYCLVDDFTHYPFLSEMSRVFDFDVIFEKNLGHEAYSLVKVYSAK